MFNSKYVRFLFVVLYSWTLVCRADCSTAAFKYPFYIGITGGYGSTTWQGLVPSKIQETDAMLISTPKQVVEGGAAGGVFAGFELNPFFAIEGSYIRYPDAKVFFDEMSLVTFTHNGLTTLVTHTETLALMAKIMMIIPCTTIRAFSSVGAAGVHRNDKLLNYWRLSPSFGVGLNYNLTQHIMSEIGLNYTAGYGQAELNPAEDYVPFLYSAFLRFAYRF